MSAPRLILASASPRRCELLRQIGVDFCQRVADIDETPVAGEAAVIYVQRMALEKARAVRQLDATDLAVLGADTSVVIEGVPLGKPRDFAHARETLKQLSGREHEVLRVRVKINSHFGASSCPSSKARGARIASLFKRRTTQLGGIDRRSRM